MRDALGSARIKLQRAKLRSRTARCEAKRFFNRQTDPVLAIEPYGEATDGNIGSVFMCQLRVVSGWPDLPDSFTARFGDAIHNYRCVLDHIAWQLVCHGLNPPSTLDESARTRVQFPIYDTEKKFGNGIEGRLPGGSGSVIDFIKSRHVYVGGHATNDALFSLG